MRIHVSLDIIVACTFGILHNFFPHQADELWEEHKKRCETNKILEATVKKQKEGISSLQTQLANQVEQAAVAERQMKNAIESLNSAAEQRTGEYRSCLCCFEQTDMQEVPR